MLRGFPRWFGVLGLMIVVWTAPVLAVTLQIGDEVTATGDHLITVVLDNEVPVLGVQAVLSYDPAKIVFDQNSYKTTARTSGWVVGGNAVGGELKLAIIDLGGRTLPAKKGAVAQMKATVTPPASLSFLKRGVELTAVFDASNELLDISVKDFTIRTTVTITKTQAVLYDEGGTVSDTDVTGAEVTIPADALEEDTEITIGVVNDAPPLPVTRKGVKAPVQFGPAGTVFTQPVTIRIRYRDPEDIPAGMAEADLVLFLYNADTGEWEDARDVEGTVSVTVDMDNNVFIVQTMHFSYYQVVAGNRPPEIVAIENHTVLEGERYSRQVVATDPDGDALTYSLSVDPAIPEMSIDATGLITWDKVLDDGDIGAYAITVTVADPAEAVSATYTLTVENVCEAPQIVVSPTWTSKSLGLNKEDKPEAITFSVVQVVDPDPGDVATYTWSIGYASGKEPATEEVLEGYTSNSLSYAFGGVLPDETATYTVSVLVSDGCGESATRSWTVEVRSKVVVPIELSRFVALVSEEGVLLNWVTSSETNNVGWDIYRSLSEDGTYVKVNARLIPGAGTSSEMRVYEYLDRTAVASSTYWYYLEQINLDGTRTPSFRISTGPTDVGEETQRRIPSAYALRNYPNPFNPVTEIEYALPEECSVRLTVYNTLGQRVAMLVDGVRPAGVYRVRWKPEHVQSGVYVYVLEAGSFVQAKKMTYLR